MNLRSEELEELNKLLISTPLDIPTFRKNVDRNGANYAWLKKNIRTRNSNLPDRLLKLLHLTK